MKKKIKKEYIKTNLIGFIIAGIIVSGVAVYAAVTFPSNEVSYSNTESGLNSNNVQGAIDELYETCTATAGDTILDSVDIVTSGDGLYKDEYEDGKYTYKGANPNNYITFNDEKAGWRIVSINSDGTIKIMRINSIGNQFWDTSGSNNWARPATVNTDLNGTYLNELTSIAQSQIVSKDWSIGSVVWDNNNLADQIYDENISKWNGKVALVTVSEYIRSNSNKNGCGSFSLNNDNYSSCKNTTWMFNSSLVWWTLSPRAGTSYVAFYVDSNGIVAGNNYNVNFGYAVSPVVYLSSEVKITGGNGTQSNPYTIE